MCHLLYQERQQSGETKEASAKTWKPEGKSQLRRRDRFIGFEEAKFSYTQPHALNCSLIF
jgi:hypothetical protein